MSAIEPRRGSAFVTVGLAVALFAACSSSGDASGRPGSGEGEPSGSGTADLSVAPSQAASVSQTLGEAEITVVYNRPVARGRRLFGELVPWGEVWNPGADQATHLRLSADVEIGGRPLPAGNYSLWAIPDTVEWTLIFHRDWQVYHFPYPGPEGEALRLRVAPRAAPPMETLAFYFPVADRRRGLLVLHWGETAIDLPIRVPRPDPAGG